MAERTGLAAILDEAGAGEQVLPEPSEQLALLGMVLPPTRKPVAGRPRGQRNYRNQRVADFILATEGDPLIELVRMGMLPVNDLAAALGCSKAEAFSEKRQCLIAVLPYVHQRQAIAVDVTNNKIVHLTISDGSPQADGLEDDGMVTLLGIVEDQEVSDDGER